MTMANSMWKSEIQYLRLIEYFLISIKKDLQYRNV